MVKNKKIILVLTNSFPNPNKIHWGIFIAQTLKHLSEYYCIEVIKPVPWVPKIIKYFTTKTSDMHTYSNLPQNWAWEGMNVHYLRFFYFPKISQSFHSIFIAFHLYFRIKCLGVKNIALINAHYLYPEGVAAVVLGKILNLPVVISARGSDVNIEATHFLKRPQIKWAINNASMVIGVSKDLCEKMQKIICYSHKIIRFIPNGINHSLFQNLDKKMCREKLSLPHDKKILLFVGRIDPVKNIINLIKAIRVLKDQNKVNFHTILIGDGPLEETIQNKIKESELSTDIVMIGMKPHNEIPVWMTAADILCLPSINEGQPNVILESLACGTPVVGSNVGGIPELINEQNGYLFSPHSINEIANAIHTAMLSNWDRESVAHTVQHLTWENTATAYKICFDNLLRDCSDN